jgi:hypothetical protein
MTAEVEGHFINKSEILKKSENVKPNNEVPVLLNALCTEQTIFSFRRPSFYVTVHSHAGCVNCLVDSTVTAETSEDNDMGI